MYNSLYWSFMYFLCRFAISNLVPIIPYKTTAMKKILTLSAIICLIQININAQNTTVLSDGLTSPAATISEVAWIAGHWRGEAFGGITEEIWSPPLGNSMMCVFRLIKEEKVGFYEIVTITEENNSLMLRLKHFHHDLKSWEEKDETVDFPLVKIENNRAMFQGFTFEKVNEKELNVYVMIGNKDGEAREMKFPYKLYNPAFE